MNSSKSMVRLGLLLVVMVGGAWFLWSRWNGLESASQSVDKVEKLSGVSVKLDGFLAELEKIYAEADGKNTDQWQEGVKAFRSRLNSAVAAVAEEMTYSKDQSIVDAQERLVFSVNAYAQFLVVLEQEMSKTLQGLPSLKLDTLREQIKIHQESITRYMSESAAKKTGDATSTVEESNGVPQATDAPQKSE